MAEHLCDFTSSDNANLHIWQWSYGQTVKLVGDNITAGMTVQWAYPGITGVDSRTITADGDDLVSNIPNDALEQVGTIYGYIYYFTEAIGETRYIINITVRERASSDETGSTDDTPTWQQLLLDAQEAIDELSAIAVPSTAGDLPYINTTSNLEAEDVQEAIDEIVASSFTPVVDTWHECTPEASLPEGSTVSLSYRKNKIGQLEIKGTMMIDNRSENLPRLKLTTLPTGYRPLARHCFKPTVDHNAGTPTPGAKVDIKVNGEIYIEDFSSPPNWFAYNPFFVILPLE